MAASKSKNRKRNPRLQKQAPKPSLYQRIIGVIGDMNFSQENFVMAGALLHVLGFLGLIAGIISTQQAAAPTTFGASEKPQGVDDTAVAGVDALIESLPILLIYAIFTLLLILYIVFRRKMLLPRVIRVSLYLLVPGTIVVLYLLLRQIF